MDNVLTYDIAYVVFGVLVFFFGILAARKPILNKYAQIAVRVLEWTKKNGLLKHQYAFTAIKWLVVFFNMEQKVTDEQIDAIIKAAVETYNSNGTFKK